MMIIFLITSTGTIASYFNNLNNPPNPPIIEGPNTGKINTAYNYFFTLTDPDTDDHLVILEIAFCDVTIQETAEIGEAWMNGSQVLVPYTWTSEGDHEIRARVQDIGELWSEWSEPFPITISKIKSQNIFIQTINKLIMMFPILEKYLN